MILSNRGLKLKPRIFSKISPISLKISQNLANRPYLNIFYEMVHGYLRIMVKTYNENAFYAKLEPI